MLLYVLRRFLLMVPTLFVISILAFIVIELPPGDYLTSYVTRLREEGDTIDQAIIDELERRYGLGQPFYVRYFKWISGILLRNDWGQSFEWRKPVKELIGERIALTVVLSTFSLIVSVAVAIPIGIYSATHQYTFFDYTFSMLSFIGRGLPGFLIALGVMWFAMSRFGLNVGGLFSEEYVLAPWSWGKVVDMLKHIWIPMLIIAVGGTASGIRTTRANVLDEIRKPYVTTARAKGVKEQRLIWKYPVRVALNPFFATLGWRLAGLISSGGIVATVLSLQTTGPLMLRALRSQDMYLAGSFVLLLSVLSVLGTLFQDILLAIVDPRIRLGG